MEWKAQTDGRRLRRIVALLLALAGLADRAAVAPFPVRFIVLAILRRAEAIAWTFAIEAVSCAPARCAGRRLPQCVSPAGAPVPDHCGPADAVRLALSFRTLALIVAELAAQAPGRASPARLRDFIVAGARPIGHAPAAVPAHDTS